jgi:hypothetical protein
MNSNNPEMARMIAANPAFGAILHQLEDDRQKQAMQHNFTYYVQGSVPSQQTVPFQTVIEQGSDFKCLVMMGSAYSYDPVNGSDFPTPNTVGNLDNACRGLSVRITDTRQGRELTSGFVPFETLFTPGYGQTFVKPLDYKYLFLRNTQIRFEVKNADGITNPNRAAHQFAIALNGYKVTSPE